MKKIHTGGGLMRSYRIIILKKLAPDFSGRMKVAAKGLGWDASSIDS